MCLVYLESGSWFCVAPQDQWDGVTTWLCCRGNCPSSLQPRLFSWNNRSTRSIYMHLNLTSWNLLLHENTAESGKMCNLMHNLNFGGDLCWNKWTKVMLNFREKPHKIAPWMFAGITVIIWKFLFQIAGLVLQLLYVNDWLIVWDVCCSLQRLSRS